MSQTIELERVKARIRALAAKTVDRGCSEAEALSAAAKVGELLDVYGLSMSEIALREEACVQRRMVVAGPGRSALFWLFPAVLRFTGCRGWTEGRDALSIFGLEPDVAMADWLLRVIDTALAHEEGRYRFSPEYAARTVSPQAALRSFRYGFGARVAERLTAMAAEREAVQAGRASTGAGSRALVVVKETKLDAGLRALGIRLRSVSRQATIRDKAAYGRGAAAGGRVGLGRPMGAGAGGAILPRG